MLNQETEENQLISEESEEVEFDDDGEYLDSVWRADIEYRKNKLEAEDSECELESLDIE